MVACLVFPVVFLLQLPPLVCELISSVGFFVAAMASLNALFTPKFYALYSGQDIDKNLEIKKAAPTTQSVHPNLPSKVKYDETIVAGKMALKGLSTDQRLEICQMQMDQWRQLQMYYGDRADTGSGTGSTGSNSRANRPSDQVHLSERTRPDSKASYGSEQRHSVASSREVPNSSIVENG